MHSGRGAMRDRRARRDHCGPRRDHCATLAHYTSARRAEEAGSRVNEYRRIITPAEGAEEWVAGEPSVRAIPRTPIPAGAIPTAGRQPATGIFAGVGKIRRPQAAPAIQIVLCGLLVERF